MASEVLPKVAYYRLRNELGGVDYKEAEEEKALKKIRRWYKIRKLSGRKRQRIRIPAKSYSFQMWDSESSLYGSSSWPPWLAYKERAMKIATALRNHSNNKADIAASLLKACSSLSHLKQIHAHIFRSNLHRNASLASTLVSLYASLSFTRYTRLTRQSHLPILLNSCAALNDLNRGTEVHGRVVRSGFGWCIPVANALIDMYGKCDALERARLAFDEMCVRDVVSHNALLGACAKGKVDMVGSQALFDGMPVKNVISWNAMIVGYVNCGDLNSAQAIFDRMPERNIVSWTTMLVGYTKNGFIDLAEVLFDKMPDQSLVCWTAMISAYAQSKRPSDALKLFWRMEKERIKPDAFTMTAVISASAQLGHADLANWMGSYMDQAGIEQNEQVLTALVDMHAKCGNIEKAILIFEKIPNGMCSLIVH
ncbi:hypothetical protein FNV43_RR21427 [Rhamnella rubrinervis]|uniref:Pentatricopeptide repeat-containing protein n=1 Tax=Rhamnella rubrinervis TaxID=2594499 RepID=A0A8K0E293_9ROSA|nr:hypothetical protein FNV43_RR21427 [Rhamnella rubrinervis]